MIYSFNKEKRIGAELGETNFELLSGDLQSHGIYAFDETLARFVFSCRWLTGEKPDTPSASSKDLWGQIKIASGGNLTARTFQSGIELLLPGLNLEGRVGTESASVWFKALAQKACAHLLTEISDFALVRSVHSLFVLEFEEGASEDIVQFYRELHSSSLWDI